MSSVKGVENITKVSFILYAHWFFLHLQNFAVTPLASCTIWREESRRCVTALLLFIYLFSTLSVWTCNLISPKLFILFSLFVWKASSSSIFFLTFYISRHIMSQLSKLWRSYHSFSLHVLITCTLQSDEKDFIENFELKKTANEKVKNGRFFQFSRYGSELHFLYLRFLVGSSSIQHINNIYVNEPDVLFLSIFDSIDMTSWNVSDIWKRRFLVDLYD